MRLFHRPHGAHAAVHLKAAALIDLGLAGAFLCTGKQAAQHNGPGTSSDGLGNITGILDAAVSDDLNAKLVSFLGAVCYRRDLRYTDA
ncbi:hypothetical protein SDC9_107331 [bioreactor metagenome]|uniref:Uncharacterized protein n=1 Tax=bioreactor metagenome TaxID=1076179 RepID=A0A645B4W3_9ZZZZ